ncbi:MAG: anthranilate phosphoribosyltransferase [Synergistaceae bacterium]|nr:anthranilate phosphoribosyltransferase [Synergistaceae bacterium]
MFKARLVQAMEGNSLTEREMEEAMEALLEEPVPPLQVAAFLAALRARGETPEEITGAVRLLLRKAHAVPSTLPLLMDNCGTGGDCTGSFNISTAAAFVAAGGGIPMAKHGNRSVSSECGSADVAEALGAPLPASPEEASRCLEETGLVLLFAPHFHPLLRNVAEVRKILGVRTLFNILGPLLNPAPLTHQVMGVFDPSLPSLIAEVLRALGRKQGMVIAGHGGFDELSLSGPNRVAFFSERGVREEFVSPEDAGLSSRGKDSVKGGSARKNASIIEGVLAGERGAPRDVVLFNAAAAFLASGQAAGWREGVAMACESIDSGRATGILEKQRDFARSESLVPQSA